MRTKNKDILMICKLWFITKGSCYDRGSALRDYLKSRTMCPEITDESILHHLTAAVGEFVNKDELLMTLKRFATDDYRATNYPDNTINFLMYGRYTKTLFPLDANYLQNKFNNLVIRWNIKYNQPFKINH